jgi:glycosyltransferase involved in cell wall biosynthesis
LSRIILKYNQILTKLPIKARLTDMQQDQNTHISKVAIVHDFFFQNGGAECVVEKLLEIYPNADIYTSIFVPSKFTNKPLLTKTYTERRIYVTWLQGLFEINKGFLLRYFKHFFWLYPLVMRFVVVRNYDLVIISSTDCAKQIRVQNDTKKIPNLSNIPKIIHYCHTPTRYLHGLMTTQDQQNLSRIQKILMPLFVFWLRKLDLNSVSYLNSKNCIWVANSLFIQQTITKIYQTKSTVIYPPVEIDKFLSLPKTCSDQEYYLCHGRISFHKRIDLAILSCLELGKNLKISGTAGLPSQITELQNIVDNYVKNNPAKANLIQFLGRTTDDQAIKLISGCKAFLFPGKEDFGIAPIEILASGTPIIAYKDGGALEYISEGQNNEQKNKAQNGIFFNTQNVKSLCDAIVKFEKITIWNELDIRNSALPYSDSEFEKKFLEL